MKIVRMVDFFERKFERKEENDFGMLFGITGFMLGGIRFILIGIILNIILVYIVLKSSGKIEKMLGKNGLGVVRKTFGVVLLAIAVKLFAANVKGLFA